MRGRGPVFHVSAVLDPYGTVSRSYARLDNAKAEMRFLADFGKLVSITREEPIVRGWVSMPRTWDGGVNPTAQESLEKVRATLANGPIWGWSFYPGPFDPAGCGVVVGSIGPQYCGQNTALLCEICEKRIKRNEPPELIEARKLTAMLFTSVHRNSCAGPQFVWGDSEHIRRSTEYAAGLWGEQYRDIFKEETTCTTS